MSKKKKKIDEVSDVNEMSELEALKARCDELENGWKRALADYDNLKKNLALEKQELRKATTESSCHHLLPVLDNFDQAVRFQPESLDDSAKNWLAGILHVRSQLEEVLHSFGAEPFGEEGDSFDPHLHEAVSERLDEKIADQIIVEVSQRGWKLGDKLLRPAKVIVNNLKNKT
jgi:molecular chaperone GrpE